MSIPEENGSASLHANPLSSALTHAAAGPDRVAKGSGLARPRLRALIVDDSPDDAELVTRELERSGFDVVWRRVDTHEAMDAAMLDSEWDVVLSDHSMPRFSSNGAINLLQRTGKDIPCIIVSGAIGEEAAVAAMRSGAGDYILKDNLARLGPVVERELRDAEVRRKRRQAEELVAHMAYHDPLTNLPNRSLFKDRFTQAIARARRNDQLVGVMFLDVDRFKTINDSLGHSVGDQLLQTVAKRLESHLREGDTVSRWGGDEFTLLFPDLDQVESTARIAQKILNGLKQPVVLGGQELFVTASIGIAVFPNDGDDVDTLLRNSDAAMYRVKEQSRNHYQLYTPTMNARAFERLAMESSLQHAVARDELVIHYQPQVDLNSGRIVGMEALVRWEHPELGLVMPAQFIPVAEETGLIVPIGMWVLRHACAQNKKWQDAGLPPVRMAVNLSARQFQQSTLVHEVARALEDSGLDARFLELEITEGIAMQYANFTVSILRDLKSTGIQTSIDDFGTGYSSLGTLSRFPFDKLKIDQGFIRGMTSNSDASAIALTMIILAKSLNRRVIAEGVETNEQLELLRNHGCDEIQGYLVSRPVPASEAVKFLEVPVLLPPAPQGTPGSDAAATGRQNPSCGRKTPGLSRIP